MSENIKTFGKVLRDLRGDDSQAKFCRKAGGILTQAYLSELENDKKTPSKTKVLQLGNALSLSQKQIDQLLITASYTPEVSIDLNNDTLRNFAQALVDPELPRFVKQKLEEDVAVVVESWYAYAQAQQSNYRRQWQDSIDVCEETVNQIIPMAWRLSDYLSDLQATAHLHLGRIKEAEKIFRYDTSSIERSNDKFLKASILVHQGDVYRDRGKWDLATEKYKGGRDEFTRLENNKRASWVNRKMAIINLCRGKWELAKSPLLTCLHTFRELEDGYEAAKTHYALGWVFNMEGSWAIARKHHEDGLELAKSWRVSGQSDDYLIMLGYSYLGNDHRQAGEYQEAEPHYRNALKLSIELNEKRERGWILLGLARTFHHLGKQSREKNQDNRAQELFTLAQQHFEAAEVVHYEVNYLYRQAMTLMHHSQLRLEGFDDQEGAEQLLHRAKSLTQEIGSSYYQAETGVYLCELYRRRKMFPELPSLVREVESLHNKYKYHHLMARLKAIQADAHIDQGQYGKAGVGFYALAFYHAFHFGNGLREEIDKRLNETLERIKSIQGVETANQFCSGILHSLKSQVNKEEQNYDLGRKEQADQLLKDLEVKARKLQLRLPLN